MSEVVQKMQAETLLEVRGLSKAFGGVSAVEDVDFDVAGGHIQGIIGPNGAGKSTLLNLISGVLSPDRGSVRLGRHRLEGLPGHKIAACGVARTFQLLRLFNNNGATVLDNVLLGAHLPLKPSVRRSIFGGGSAENRQRERARAWLDFFGLSALENEQPQNLAFGDQRYVELARAMMLEPKLLLLDEPASGLNDAEVVRFAEVLRKIRSEGVTIVLIEHDMKLVMGVCDQILVLAQGQRLAMDTPAGIRAHPEVVAAYLGTSAEG